MPPIDAPMTATSFFTPNFSAARRCDEFTMSRMLNFGNFMPGCAFEFDGEVVRPLAMASVAMMKYFAGSSARPGPIR
jgi:hypothetical protein